MQIPGVIATNAGGMFPSAIIYDDTNVEQLESIPDSAPHRVVDLAIVKADQEGTYAPLLSMADYRSLQVGLPGDRIC